MNYSLLQTLHLFLCRKDIGNNDNSNLKTLRKIKFNSSKTNADNLKINFRKAKLRNHSLIETSSFNYTAENEKNLRNNLKVQNRKLKINKMQEIKSAKLFDYLD